MKRLFTLSILLGCALVALPAAAQEVRVGNHGLRVGAGILGYFSGGAPGTSGAWDVRYTYSPFRLVGFEAAYTGAAGDSPGGTAVATILTGNVKVSPAGINRSVSPFVGAGLGYGGFSNSGPQRGDAATLVVPLSGGADFRLNNRFTATGRFTYHLTTDDEYGPTRSNTDSWSLIAGIGSAF